MRISSNYIYNTYLKYDKTRQKDIEKYTKELSSGKRILTPSDDPISLAQSLRFKSVRKDLDGYLKNIKIVQNTQEIAEESLKNIIESSQEARAEIVRLHNTGVLDSEDAKILRDYFKDIKDYIINQANVKIGDKYIFSGVKSQNAPIDTSDGTYNGETEETTVPISKGVEVPIRFNGKDYLGVDSNDNKMILVKTLDKVIDIIDNAVSGSGSLNSINDPNAITVNGQSMSILEAFDKGLDAVMQHRSVIGTQNRTADDLKSQHEMFKVHYSNLISTLEDADFTQSVAELEKSKVAYEATIASFNQNKDLSLLNYFK